MTEIVLNNEREWWNYFYGSSEEGDAFKADCKRKFNKLFEGGHKHSLRELIAASAKPAREGFFFGRQWWSGLDKVHPIAFGLFGKYGVDYKPIIFRKPAPFGEPKSGQCYQNSLTLLIWHREWLKRHPRVRRRKLPVYVEGIAMGPVVEPMLHSWNAKTLETKKAVDWTLYASCRWTRYLGIPFTLEEHDSIAQLTGRTNLFEKKYFNPKARKRVREILEHRTT